MKLSKRRTEIEGRVSSRTLGAAASSTCLQNSQEELVAKEE